MPKAPTPHATFAAIPKTSASSFADILQPTSVPLNSVTPDAVAAVSIKSVAGSVLDGLAATPCQTQAVVEKNQLAVSKTSDEGVYSGEPWPRKSVWQLKSNC